MRHTKNEAIKGNISEGRVKKKGLLFVTTTVLLAISTVFPIKPRIENEKIAVLSVDQDTSCYKVSTMDETVLTMSLINRVQNDILLGPGGVKTQIRE